MIRTALSTVLLLVASAAAAQTPQGARMRTDSQGVLHVELARAGQVSLCASGTSTMAVLTEGRKLTITNGRFCRPGEAPVVSMDTANCVISNTTVKAAG